MKPSPTGKFGMFSHRKQTKELQKIIILKWYRNFCGKPIAEDNVTESLNFTPISFNFIAYRIIYWSFLSSISSPPLFPLIHFLIRWILPYNERVPRKNYRNFFDFICIVVIFWIPTCIIFISKSRNACRSNEKN